MHIPKELIVKELEKQGKSDRVQHVLQELPEKVDHEQHAELLLEHGIDPGKLVAKAAEGGLEKL
jgi:hypothetical protein